MKISKREREKKTFFLCYNSVFHYFDNFLATPTTQQPPPQRVQETFKEIQYLKGRLKVCAVTFRVWKKEKERECVQG
jgi:hypothetical protein